MQHPFTQTFQFPGYSTPFLPIAIPNGMVPHIQQTNAPFGTIMTPMQAHQTITSAVRFPGSTYGYINQSKLKINKGNIPETVKLPSEFDEQWKPFDLNYNFGLELETISQISEERRMEAKIKEQEDRKRKERELKAQEEAWNAVLDKRNRTSTPPRNTSSLSPKDPNTLVDLNFEEKHSNSKRNTPSSPVSRQNSSSSAVTNQIPNPKLQQKPAVLSSSKNAALYSKLIEMGLNGELVATAIEILGPEDEFKVIGFITDFQKLEEHPERFPRSWITQALLLHEHEYSKSLVFLQEFHRLSKLGIKDAQILEALSMFSYDMKQASSYLIGFKSLKELGFNEMKIQEALVMCNNDSQKAAQYLLENV